MVLFFTDGAGRMATSTINYLHSGTPSCGTHGQEALLQSGPAMGGIMSFLHHLRVIMGRITVLVCGLVLWVWVGVVHAALPNQGVIPDHYIIKLVPAVLPTKAANGMAKAHGLTIKHVYRHAFNGFAARVPSGRLAGLKRDPRVASVVPDRYVSISKPPCGTPPCGGNRGNDGGNDGQPPQETPTGILRINGTSSSTVAGNGSGTVNIDVAVIDTGIANHADLNVVGGINCSNGPANRYKDGNGHGTHVAGTIAAIDNTIGVVGVAPGSRLWAVRVLNNAGSGSWSSVMCGLDFVAANASTIKVANMSIGGSGSEGSCTDGGLHETICNTINSGVAIVVAAGNESDDAKNHVPASYNEVITVSALADFDGKADGLGSATCRSDEDDSFANFSNYGVDIDIIAPGVCIKSTWNDGNYNTISGTSMASPHVAGAAALYLANNPGSTPTQVKQALISGGSYNWNNSDDGDSTQEPLLDVSGF